MTEDEKDLLKNRYDLAIDSIDHARICIKDFRGDLALKALDVAEHQVLKLKPQ